MTECSVITETETMLTDITLMLTSPPLNVTVVVCEVIVSVFIVRE